MTNQQIIFTANWLGAKLAAGLIVAAMFTPMVRPSAWPLSVVLFVLGILCYLAAHWYLGKLR